MSLGRGGGVVLPNIVRLRALILEMGVKGAVGKRQEWLNVRACVCGQLTRLRTSVHQLSHPWTSMDQLSCPWASVDRLSPLGTSCHICGCPYPGSHVPGGRCMEHWGGSWGLERVQAGKDGWAGLGALAALFPIGIADVTGLVR